MADVARDILRCSLLSAGFRRQKGVGDISAENEYETIVTPNVRVGVSTPTPLFE